jgi:dienelactone hydrolase
LALRIEDPAQRRDLGRQVALVDRRPAPHGGHDLVSRDDLAMAFDQHLQQIESARSHRHRRQSPVRLDPEKTAAAPIEPKIPEEKGARIRVRAHSSLSAARDAIPRSSAYGDAKGFRRFHFLHVPRHCDFGRFSGRARPLARLRRVEMRAYAATVLLACLFGNTVARAVDISAPVEYHGRQIQLAGQFQKPAGPGPFPVVVALHDCNGYYASPIGAWLDLLWQQGYATLRLDSFTARGYSEVCEDSKILVAEQGLDALAAAYVLAWRPDVEPDRIAVIGQSHGGAAAAFAATDGDRTRSARARLATRGGKLVASVDLYGGCLSATGHPVVVPLLVLVGAKDDWIFGGRSCLALAKGKATPIVTVYVYPNAYHAFDVGGAPRRAFGHMLGYDADAAADARSRVSKFRGRYLH